MAHPKLLDGPAGRPHDRGVDTHARAALGADDVTDAELAGMVADLWDVPRVRLLDSRAEPVAYDTPSMLTSARTWVSGRADAGSGPRPFRFFVKHVHHWRHSPVFTFVPEHLRELAAPTVPWRAEVLVYRSDLAEHLPEGLAAPRALKVEDLPDEHAVIWLEAVEPAARPWDEQTYRQAAHLLGRLAASPQVRPYGALDPQPWHIDFFVQGRLGAGVVPVVTDPAAWEHPVVAPHFAHLRQRLLAAVSQLPSLAQEFAAAPVLPSHGDACPANLLPLPDGRGFTLVDFGFWRPQPVGFDLSQLLVGELQVGREDGDGLDDRAQALLAAYRSGLEAEGMAVDPAVLRRSHAVAFLLFAGVPSFPVELLGQPESDALHRQAAQRAAVCAYALDVLEETGTARREPPAPAP